MNYVEELLILKRTVYNLSKSVHISWKYHRVNPSPYEKCRADKIGKKFAIS